MTVDKLVIRALVPGQRLKVKIIDDPHPFAGHVKSFMKGGEYEIVFESTEVELLSRGDFPRHPSVTKAFNPAQTIVWGEGMTDQLREMEPKLPPGQPARIGFHHWMIESIEVEDG